MLLFNLAKIAILAQIEKKLPNVVCEFQFEEISNSSVTTSITPK